LRLWLGQRKKETERLPCAAAPHPNVRELWLPFHIPRDCDQGLFITLALPTHPPAAHAVRVGLELPAHQSTVLNQLGNDRHQTQYSVIPHTPQPIGGQQRPQIGFASVQTHDVTKSARLNGVTGEAGTNACRSHLNKNTVKLGIQRSQ
jgi:hypothetical protein